MSAQSTPMVKQIRRLIQAVVKDVLKVFCVFRLLPGWPAKKPEMDGYEVLITGGHGYGNVGDEAQLNANIERWKKTNPDARLIILTPHPAYTAKEHACHPEFSPRVIWFNANHASYYWDDNLLFAYKFYCTAFRQLLGARLVRAGLPPLVLSAKEAHLIHLIQRASVLHISGGGFLTGMTRSRLWENALLLRLAHILKTPSILTGQTIGVFKSGMDRKLARWAFKNAEMILLRDKDGSENDLRAVGLEGPHIRSLFDDALFCQKCSEIKRNEALQRSGLDSSKPYIAVNYHFWGMSAQEKETATERFAEICNYITTTYTVQLLLLPMAPSDEGPLKELSEKLSGEFGLLVYEYDFRIARGIISGAQWVFTMKHHPIIFAQGEAVPVIAVCLDDYYYRKNKGALANFEHEEFCLDKDVFYSDAALKKIDETVSHLNQLKEGMVEQLVEYKKQNDHILEGLV